MSDVSFEGNTSMIISISSEIKHAWPNTCLGCLVWHCKDCTEAEDLWLYAETEILPAVKSRLADTALADMPNLSQARKAYKTFGKDPGRLRVSSEALYRRIRQNKDLYRINSVVDVNNLISVQTGFSLGSYDLSCLSDVINFRLGIEGETYAGIGKDNIDLNHLPLLADDNWPFGSPSSDSTRAMITEATTNILTVIYGFSGINATEKALELAKMQIVRFANATSITLEYIS